MNNIHHSVDAGDDAPLIQIRGLTFRRGGRTIFDRVDMDIPRGKVTAVMGPSGTGKTTLLKLISGVLRPQAGSIKVAGQEVTTLSRDGLYALRKQMGMLFQSGALLTDLNVFDNVAYPVREHTDLPESLVRSLVLMKLQAVGLRGARELTASELSGGMARRVALARAIALDPMLILYDEPFTGQDPISMGILTQLISSLNRALGLTSLVVSHDIEETCRIADYAYVIAQGKVIGHGVPENLQASEEPMVHQFLSGEADGPVHFHYPAVAYRDDLLANAP
ncbi:MAG TPA: phospholipid ABC transporter ATP-binding protein MlaF [Gammaproteobacteria bacterium]|uniref:ABC transporter ATP-binding protein n=1 Tax=Immundisolibacter sp. TaxID=1934948 RepID=UPI000E9082B3|nr:phospholipid ABC transporter ATP-binding protein MlaF [Gammaproteobacteria bacterium]MCH77899.1 phospholipid ABC transporter ATP-binding protein MlaF [Gammaproteobacteria bacterium]